MKLFASLCFLIPLLAPGAPAIPETWFNPPPRKIQVDDASQWVLSDGKNSFAEIVVPPEAGTVAMFAGKELQHFLKESTGADFPIVSSRSKAKYAIRLGINSALDTASLHRDGFFIKTSGNELWIAGRDSLATDMDSLLKSRSGNFRNEFNFERGTLFGVYDFLERFAGIRFYFHGPVGTFVPKHAEMKIPARIDLMDRPDCTVRNVSWVVLKQQEWYDDTDSMRGSNLNQLRWRLQTHVIPNCHGLAWIGYRERFTKTHPEYFALMENGKRHNDSTLQHTGQLCLSNQQLRNEIYEDAKSALKGEPASVRGVVMSGYGTSVWSSPAFQPGFINIMPQDAFYKCRCPECRKYFDKGGKSASNLIWEMTAEVATRLKKDGVGGYVTQMGYDFYSIVPDTEIPDNVLVMLASVEGPWGAPSMQSKEDTKILDWNRKLKKKIWLWNYCINNADWGENYGVPGMPHFTPKAVGNYYRRHKNEIAGAFLESESHRFIWGALNQYAAARALWNADTDMNALMDEFYRNMFGAGAPPMKDFFDTLEKNWLKTRKKIDTPLGPQMIRPTQYSIWMEVYSPEELQRLKGLFNEAEKLAAKDPDSLKRIAFFKKNFLDEMDACASDFMKTQNDKSELYLEIADGPEKNARKVYLRPLKDGKAELRVSASAWRDEKNLYFSFHCDEPEMNRLKAKEAPRNSMEIFSGTTFEIFLNPSADRKNYFQFILNPKGSLCAIEYPSRKVWTGEAAASVRTGPNFWEGRLSLPLSQFPQLKTGGFPLNFSYNRQLEGSPEHNVLYSWSPFVTTSFHELDNYGTGIFDKVTDKNLVKDWNFEAEPDGEKLGAWLLSYPSDPSFAGAIETDPTTFVSGGKSLYMRMDSGTRLDAVQNLMLRPDTTYRLSYYLKYDTSPAAAINVIVNTGKNQFLPQLPIRGKNPWVRQEFTFKTPPASVFDGKAHIRLCIVAPKAEVWFDNIRITEINH